MITWKRLCFSFKGRINRTIYWQYIGATFTILLFMGAVLSSRTELFPYSD